MLRFARNEGSNSLDRNDSFITISSNDGNHPMKRLNSIHLATYAVVAACVVLFFSSSELHGRPQHPATSAQAQPNRPMPPGYRHPIPGAFDHLPEWLASHQNLPIEQEQMLLRSTPAFRQLPAASQQRLLDQLARIHAMSPARRERYLERNEAIERLNPQQREAFQQSVHALSQLPQAHVAAVSQAFRALRRLPPDQRLSQLNAAPYATGLSDQERQILSNLLMVEPYQPAPSATLTPAGSPSAPK